MADGAIVMVAVGLAVGVGDGMSIIVGVGVGVMIVFCCSKVLVISVSCFLSTEDWEYINMDAEIPTPAKSRRMIVSSDEVGALGRFEGIDAGWGCGSVFGVKIGSGGEVGVGGVTGVCGSGSRSLSFKSLKGLLGTIGGVELSVELENVGSSSGVASKEGGAEGSGGVVGASARVSLPDEAWLFVVEGGLGKLPKSSFAMLNLVWQILMSVSRKKQCSIICRLIVF